MMLWLTFGFMLFIAALVVAVPLFRIEKRLSLNSVVSVVAVVVVAAVTYSYIGSPGTQSGRGEMPDIDAMVESLAARLEQSPDDLAGWKMLGRSYLQLQDFPAARTAFENAVRLESSQNAQTLSDLGEAILLGDGRALNGEAGQFFESALAISPSNPKALFYSGLAAVERGESELGAERWEALLATSPPPNIAEILRERIAELRGDSVPLPAESSSAQMTALVALGDAAKAAEIPDATVFVIVRDPDQPSPPIAAVRRRVSELPAEVALSDADAMIPGRVPSAYDRLEIVARISMSGEPIAQSGDWFGQTIIDKNSSLTGNISINQQVP